MTVAQLPSVDVKIKSGDRFLYIYFVSYDINLQSQCFHLSVVYMD